MKYYLVKIKIIFLFLFFSTWSFGQVVEQPFTQPARVELKADSYENEFEVLPLLSDSSLLVYQHPYTGSFKEGHQFYKYNHNLDLLWTIDIKIDNDLQFKQIITHKNYTYLLYTSYIPTEFHLLKINNTTSKHTLNKYSLKDLDLYSDARIDEFQVIGEKLFLLGRSTRTGFVLHLNTETNEIKALPALFEQPTGLTAYYMDTLSNRAEFVISESNGIKGRLQIKRFSTNGDLYSTHFVQPPYRKNLITTEISPGDSASKILIGTYATRDFQYAQGLFTSFLHTPPGEQQFFDFIQFNHFFDFLGKKSQQRLLRRADRFERKQKELRFRYRLLLHEIQVRKDTLYLVADFYTPQYRENAPQIAMLNVPRRSSFDGYRFTHTLVCAFDRKGNLLWDNSFVLKEAEQFNLGKIMNMAFAGDNLILAYAHEKDIRYKIVNRDKTSDNTLAAPITTLNEKEKITSTENPNLHSWYGSHFIAFGFQRIRHPQNPAREVFYLNKVSF